MAEERVQRRLAAILAADVVGYSRLMGEDEAGTRARFSAVSEWRKIGGMAFQTRVDLQNQTIG